MIADRLANYPYDFELKIIYTLIGKTIKTSYQVTNRETEKVMPYFIGGHPGFNCPLLADECYEELPDWVKSDGNRLIVSIIIDEAKRRVMQAIKESGEP